MTACIKHFCQGFGWPWVRVAYSTRHYSRCYAVGVTTQGTLIVLLPVALVFGVGFLAGRYL